MTHKCDIYMNCRVTNFNTSQDEIAKPHSMHYMPLSYATLHTKPERNKPNSFQDICTWKVSCIFFFAPDNETTFSYINFMKFGIWIVVRSIFPIKLTGYQKNLRARCIIANNNFVDMPTGKLPALSFWNLFLLCIYHEKWTILKDL